MAVVCHEFVRIAMRPFSTMVSDFLNKYEVIKLYVQSTIPFSVFLRYVCMIRSFRSTICQLKNPPSRKQRTSTNGQTQCGIFNSFLLGYHSRFDNNDLRIIATRTHQTMSTSGPSSKFSHILDWVEAMEQCGNDEEFLRELLSDLRGEIDAQIKKIDDVLKVRLAGIIPFYFFEDVASITLIDALMDGWIFC